MKVNKVLVEKDLLESTVDALRDVSTFISKRFFNEADEVMQSVLLAKNGLVNTLIVNPDRDPNGKPQTALELIDQMLR